MEQTVVGIPINIPVLRAWDAVEEALRMKLAGVMDDEQIHRLTGDVLRGLTRAARIPNAS